MAQYRNAVMTQNGAALLNKAQAGLCKIKFTRISTGDGEYSESEKGIEELRKITSLKSHKQSFMFDSIKYLNDTSVELKASITNHDDTQTLSVGYYIREIAVFAQEDDENDTEVLYSIAVANVADFLPPYNGNNPTLIIQKYYATVDESRSAITVPSHYGEDLDAVKEDLEKEWKKYAENIDEEMKKRPEKDGKADEMTVTFTEAANRENIVTGEKASTLMGKIKKWLADLAAAAFMQVVTSYSDLMAGTALDNYLIGAAAAKEGFTELNGKLSLYTYGDKVYGSSSTTISPASWSAQWISIVIPDGYSFFTAICCSDNDVVCGVSAANYDSDNNRLLVNAYNRHTQSRDFSHVYIVPIFIRD